LTGSDRSTCPVNKYQLSITGLANVTNVWYPNVMNVRQINDLLLAGELEVPGLFPHLDALRKSPFVFDFDFGLDELPPDPGILIIRGARQIGKSTWLEQKLKTTLETYGPGHALYLNGDEIPDAQALTNSLRLLLPLLSDRRPARIFIDEITAIKGWERAIKRLADAGELKTILVVTTGSNAMDLRRGSERLPGRKGRLERTEFVFLPIAFPEFHRRCGDKLGLDAMDAYLLCGGIPAACCEIAHSGCLPEHIVASVRDWILGEVARSGRSRASLLCVMNVLHRFGGSPVGQAKLAREAGLSNNTVAAGYIELLADLMCVGVEIPWDSSRAVGISRKPAKFPFINLLAAVTWSPSRIRSVAEFQALPADLRGRWYEWLVAQELWRRSALRGDETPEQLSFWRSREHELDFVIRPDLFVEVKTGTASPLDFTWFPHSFPNARLLIVNQRSFRNGPLEGITMEQFMSSPNDDFA
jgi:uncharacterized protein